MPLVLDASAIIPLAMSDEDAAFSLRVVASLADDGGVAPSLFWYEVRNVLAISERRRRIAPAVVDDFIGELEKLPIQLSPTASTQAVMQIVRQYQLTFYDASYLELAIRMGAVLATQDGQLARAALAANVPLFSAAS
jgi:predicted nucleic acid-binding protein